MTYRNQSLKYLHRAKLKLSENLDDSFIYAALDLRMAIEARLQQYAEANKEITKSNLKEWRVSNISKELENAFNQRDKIAEVSIFYPEESKPVYSFFYTPVSKSLQSMAGKLGDFLHYGKNQNIEQCKALLLKIIPEVELANKGTLLGVPMLNTKTGQLEMKIEPESIEEADNFTENLNSGKVITLRVNYHEAYPQ